jgi:hypothetical protein
LINIIGTLLGEPLFLSVSAAGKMRGPEYASMPCTHTDRYIRVYQLAL